MEKERNEDITIGIRGKSSAEAMVTANEKADRILEIEDLNRDTITSKSDTGIEKNLIRDSEETMDTLEGSQSSNAKSETAENSSDMNSKVDPRKKRKLKVESNKPNSVEPSKKARKVKKLKKSRNITDKKSVSLDTKMDNLKNYVQPVLNKNNRKKKKKRKGSKLPVTSR